MRHSFPWFQRTAPLHHPTVEQHPQQANIADARRIVLLRGLRQLAYGCLAVLSGVALAVEEFSPFAIGTLITLSLVGDVAGTSVIRAMADTWGRRRTQAGLALLMAGTGVVFGLTSSYPALMVAAFSGTPGTSASETAPFLPIDQAMIAQVTRPEQRTALFARYNLVASLCTAVDAPGTSVPDLLTHVGLPRVSGLRLLFGVSALLALLVAGLSLRLSAGVEASPHRSPQEQRVRFRLAPELSRSRGVVGLLTALFSVDALAGGLGVQSLLVLFFYLRFGVSLTTLAALFFGANLLSALSFLAAVPLTRRSGLLNTMVFTHLPSNILLLLVAFASTFPLAAGLLLFRQPLPQMDIPTRQAYTIALVEPSERTAAASVTSLARSVGSSTSPVVAGLLLQGSLLLVGIPFILVGTLKAAYDLTLWALFRRAHVPEEPS